MTEPASNEQDFFIGWADTPAADRRFFLRAGVGLSLGAVALGGTLAALQRPPGPGQWDPDDVREWRGQVSAAPYATLRTRELGATTPSTTGGEPRTALLSCLGKCGVNDQIAALAGQPVVVTGSLIQRGRHAMVAVDENGPWIRRDEGAAADPVLAMPEPEFLGEVDLTGEILDSKCWFGAMRPAQGKTHKACAALCIRGGIPPAFFARDGSGRGALMIMRQGGAAYGPDLLPLVADPVRLRGRVYRHGDLLMVDAPLVGITRV
jgi:hypothetical protein